MLCKSIWRASIKVRAPQSECGDLLCRRCNIIWIPKRHVFSNMTMTSYISLLVFCHSLQFTFRSHSFSHAFIVHYSASLSIKLNVCTKHWVFLIWRWNWFVTFFTSFSHHITWTKLQTQVQNPFATNQPHAHLTYHVTSQEEKNMIILIDTVGNK